MNRTIPGAAGPIPVRIYTPKGAGPFPVVVYYHGGGWVIANLDTYDASARALAKMANAVVVSVALSAGARAQVSRGSRGRVRGVRWVLENAGLGGDPTGRGRRRERRRQPRGRGADDGPRRACRCRSTCVGVSHRGRRPETPSYKENADAMPLNAPGWGGSSSSYLGSGRTARAR